MSTFQDDIYGYMDENKKKFANICETVKSKNKKKIIKKTKKAECKESTFVTNSRPFAPIND